MRIRLAYVLVYSIIGDEPSGGRSVALGVNEFTVVINAGQ